MKRQIIRALALAFVLAVLLGALSGCADQERTDAEIVCTIYPIYDWTVEILGEHAERYKVLCLSDGGEDPHNYQPTVTEIAAVKDSRLFLSSGGITDAWVAEIAKPTGAWLTLIDEVELCTEDHSDHAHGDGHGHGETGHYHDDVDEHFWLSLENARRAVIAITEELCEIYAEDTAAVSDFRSNAAAYVERLVDLDTRYAEAVQAAERDTVLVADRFPYLYLFERYGIRYHAAFPGCSAETEASFATVASLIERVKELKLSVVLITETGKPDLAETVVAASGQGDVSILVLHSCQSVTEEERAGGMTYLSIMEENLAVVKAALAA